MRFFPLVAGLLCCLALAPASAQVLYCKPCWHSFGNTQIGSSTSFSIPLSNVGKKTLRITSKLRQGTEFSIGTFPLPVTLQPGASVELPVIFKPTREGYSLGVFQIVSTAKDPSITMYFTGVGEGAATNPQLGISPATLNFGNVTVGSSVQLQATITASNAAVTISSDQSTSSEFVLLDLKLPVTIAAGQRLPVTIQFTPNASGTASGKAGFVSNATDSPAVAQLTGTGVPPSAHSVDLSWAPGAENVVGYNVFRSTVQGGPYEQINTALEASTSYTDSTVAAGTTYYYVTTEVNAEGQESGYSNVAKAVIPNS
jgi:hypothetical protein